MRVDKFDMTFEPSYVEVAGEPYAFVGGFVDLEPRKASRIATHTEVSLNVETVDGEPDRHVRHIHHLGWIVMPGDLINRESMEKELRRYEEAEGTSFSAGLTDAVLASYMWRRLP